MKQILLSCTPVKLVDIINQIFWYDFILLSSVVFCVIFVQITELCQSIWEEECPLNSGGCRPSPPKGVMKVFSAFVSSICGLGKNSRKFINWAG